MRVVCCVCTNKQEVHCLSGLLISRVAGETLTGDEPPGSGLGSKHMMARGHGIEQQVCMLRGGGDWRCALLR